MINNKVKNEMYLLDNILFDFANGFNPYDMEYILNYNFSFNHEEIRNIIKYLNIFKYTNNKVYLLKVCYEILRLLKLYENKGVVFNYFELEGVKRFNNLY